MPLFFDMSLIFSSVLSLLTKEEFMKKIIFTIFVSFLSLSAFAERYVMVTHGEGKDPFWPVAKKGGEDAARHVGADFEYIFNPSGDMGDMAKPIAAAYSV